MQNIVDIAVWEMSYAQPHSRKVGNSEKLCLKKAKGVVQPFLVGTQGRAKSRMANLSPGLNLSSYLLYTCLMHFAKSLYRPLLHTFMRKYLSNRWFFVFYR